QLAKLFELSVEIDRRALGIATVGEEVRLNQSQERLEVYKQVVESKKGNDLDESSGFIEGIQKLGIDIWKEEREAIAKKQPQTKG
ncbi:MAG TPA: hypothetical protein VIK72_13695, partial [Clostridiaceae bacterium]